MSLAYMNTVITALILKTDVFYNIAVYLKIIFLQSPNNYTPHPTILGVFIGNFKDFSFRMHNDKILFFRMVDTAAIQQCYFLDSIFWENVGIDSVRWIKKMEYESSLYLYDDVEYAARFGLDYVGEFIANGRKPLEYMHAFGFQKDGYNPLQIVLVLEPKVNSSAEPTYLMMKLFPSDVEKILKEKDFGDLLDNLDFSDNESIDFSVNEN
jgi:hypothetical protein